MNVPMCERCQAPVKQVTGARRFCSAACWYAFQNETRPRVACGTCNELFVPTPNRRTHCSRVCGRKALAQPRVTPEPSPVDGARWVALTKGAFALVDDDDHASMDAHTWTLSRDGYAFRQIHNGPRVTMHRVIIAATRDQSVDHANGNRLDNRRANLRVATQSQNMANTRKKSNARQSKFKGIQWNRGTEKWDAMIAVEGRRSYLGSATDPADAAKLYDNAARKHRGDFACVNFPRDGERGALATAP